MSDFTELDVLQALRSPAEGAGGYGISYQEFEECFSDEYLEARVDLQTALNRMDARTRFILLAVGRDDWTHERVGRALGIHRTTVSRTFKEGLCALTAFLNQS